MRIIKPEQLEKLKESYPNGTRVELVRMDDIQSPPIGTKGTVYGIDDDRGWDIEPEDEASQLAYAVLIKEYN